MFQNGMPKFSKTIRVYNRALDAACAGVAAVDANVLVLLPAQRATASAALEQAEVELDKTTVCAGTAGRVQQFVMQVGDIVYPMLCSAGILDTASNGHFRFHAAFSQISARSSKRAGSRKFRMSLRRSKSDRLTV